MVMDLRLSILCSHSIYIRSVATVVHHREKSISCGTSFLFLLDAIKNDVVGIVKTDGIVGPGVGNKFLYARRWEKVITPRNYVDRGTTKNYAFIHTGRLSFES